MSATLTVYSMASPRSCDIAAGATRTLRDQARPQISVRMSGLLEQQTRGNHRSQHNTGDEQPCARVAHVQGVAKANTFLDSYGRVAWVEVQQAADFPRVVGFGVSVNLLPLAPNRKRRRLRRLFWLPLQSRCN